MGERKPAGSPAACGLKSAGGEPCDRGMENSSVTPSPQQLPPTERGMSAVADKSRGFTGRSHGAKADPPGMHMRLDDALQRALEHPKYRMTALRFEEAFIDFIESGEQRMVIDESLTGFGKCIAHRVAKLYGLETLTVSNSENTPSVGVRRTRKSVHIPAVKLKDLYQIRHPWAPEERPQAQGSAGTAGAAGQVEQGGAVPEAAATAAAAPGAAAAPPGPGDSPDAPSGAAPAPLAAQTSACPSGPTEGRVGAAQDSAPQPGVSEGAAQQPSTALSISATPATAEGILPGPVSGAEAAAGHKQIPTSLQPSKAGLEPGGAATDSLTAPAAARPERDAQQKAPHLHQQKLSSSEDRMSHEREWQPAQSLPAAESLSQSGGSSVLQGLVAAHSSQTRSSEAQDTSQPQSHVVTPITSGESLTASRSDRSEGSQMPWEATLGFRDTRRRRGFAGRSDKAGSSFLGPGISAGHGMGPDMPVHEGHGKAMMLGGTHASSGTRSPVSSMAGQRAGSRKGRQGASDRSSDLSKFQQREMPGAYTRGRDQLHTSEWRGDQSQVKQGRPELAQASPDVPPSPFSNDPRAAPSQAILEQQMSQRLSIDPGHHTKLQMSMSEPQYRPHAQQTKVVPLPPVTSGSAAASHQQGFLSPLLPNLSGQLPGAQAPYGSFGPPLAIPPGYMLVPAPGAVQGMPVYQAPLQPYPIPGHPGYYYLPPGPAAPLPEGHMGYHSAQHGLTWDAHGAPYSHTPRPPMQAGMHPPPHARLPPGMGHPYMASPPMWPGQAAVQLPSQQQPHQAEAPQQIQHHHRSQAEHPWQLPSQRPQHLGRYQPTSAAPSIGRSGNLSRQHSGGSRRSQSDRQLPRQQQ